MHRHHHMDHMHHMHHMNHHGSCGRARPVICPTTYRFHDSFTEREVPFVHPVVNVNRQNVVNVPRHYFTETSASVPGRDIYDPGFGGHGGHCGFHGDRC
ncbi:spore coat protein D [Bhargavaea cecembensis]|uniref:spore coat protein D n=1 Tax=Bhargavaea cecembensis TaxID=394098 RepID=UPI0011781404|nr:spore coat protein D [Bhargavaea cecembensis]